MFDDKALYIERLLKEIKILHESVSEVKNSGNLPFSFFKESFNKTSEINDLLHKLEFIQVDDLKIQMERLVSVLTEKEKKEKEAAEEKLKKIEREQYQKTDQVRNQDNIQADINTYDAEDNKEPEKESDEVFTPEQHIINKLAEKIAFPEYRNPNNLSDNQYKNHFPDAIEEDNSNKTAFNENSVKKTIIDSSKSPRSLNDIIKTPPAVVDLKRGISLNDKFLFQRELFGNDLQRMNRTIEILSNSETYEDAEEYIRENVTTDLENPIVIDFLSIVRKGFK